MFFKQKFFALLILTAGIISLTGCETLDGAGQDIEKAGEAVQDAAQ